MAPGGSAIWWGWVDRRWSGWTTLDFHTPVTLAAVAESGMPGDLPTGGSGFSPAARVAYARR